MISIRRGNNLPPSLARAYTTVGSRDDTRSFCTAFKKAANEKRRKY